MKACPSCKSKFGDSSAEFCPNDGVRLVPIVDTTGSGHRGDYDKLIGQTIDGRYVVDGKLGEGGMGVVLKAHHNVIEKTVAIKVLRRDLARDPSVVQRFLQEAKAASRIGHPNIVDVLDFGTLKDGAVYSVMEFIPGETLGKILRDEGRLPVGRAIPIIAQLAKALSAAHDKGIVHRDLKPDNIFVVERQGKPDFVKIVDFGIAKMLEQEGTIPSMPRLTRAGSIFGTPDYMSPEQASGRSDTDGRVDIYALGTILYEMLVGFVPHRAENPLAVLTMQITEEIVPPNLALPHLNLSVELEAVIMMALAKDRDLRYRSMRDLTTALQRVAGSAGLEQPVGKQTITSVMAAPGQAAALMGPDGVATVPGTGMPQLPFGGSAPHGYGALPVGALHGPPLPGSGAVPRLPGVPGPMPLQHSPPRGVAALPSIAVVYDERSPNAAPSTDPSMLGAQTLTDPRRGGGRRLTMAALLGIALAATTAITVVAIRRRSQGAEALDGGALAGPTPKELKGFPPDELKGFPDAAPLAPDASTVVVPDAADVVPDTYTVVIFTSPPGGYVYVDGKLERDEVRITRPRGTELVARCRKERREPGKVRVRFDGRSSIFTCKMPELKDPFAPKQ